MNLYFNHQLEQNPFNSVVNIKKNYKEVKFNKYKKYSILEDNKESRKVCQQAMVKIFNFACSKLLKKKNNLSRLDMIFEMYKDRLKTKDEGEIMLEILSDVFEYRFLVAGDMIEKSIEDAILVRKVFYDFFMRDRHIIEYTNNVFKELNITDNYKIFLDSMFKYLKRGVFRMSHLKYKSTDIFYKLMTISGIMPRIIFKL